MKKNSYSSMLQLLLAYWLFMLIDFFITKNPFMAFSANINYGNKLYISTSFVINQSFIVILSLAVFNLWYGKIVISPICYISIFILIFSGIVNGGLKFKPISYVLNILSFALTCSFAYIVYGVKKYNEKRAIILLAKISTLLIILGVILACIRPGVYGVISFEFTRSHRGNITLWSVLGLQLLYPALSLVIYDLYKKKFYLIITLFMAFFHMASYNRANFIEIILPIIFYYIVRVKSKLKYFLILSIPFVVVFFKEAISEMFLLGESINIVNLSAVLNGRFELWEYCINRFLSHFWFGNGVRYIGRENNYKGATAEIGFFQWFAESGVIYGGLMLILIIKSFCISLKNVKNRNENNPMKLMCSYIILSSLYSIFQSYYRILTVKDIIYWFAIYYINIKLVNPKTIKINLWRKS